MANLYELIEDVLNSHLSMHNGGCECGHNEDLTWNEYVAQEIGDMLIDLAGTGQLLASINRIAR